MNGYNVIGLDDYVKDFTDLSKPDYAREAEGMLEDRLEAYEIGQGPLEVILEEEKTAAGIPATFTFEIKEEEEGPEAPVLYLGHDQ